MRQVLDTIKQGDTLVLACEYEGDLTNCVVTCSMETERGQKLGNAKVTILDAAKGLYEVDFNSLNWPLGAVLFDIRYSWGSTTRATHTVAFNVIRPITPVVP